MKFLKREKIAPICMAPNDSIVLSYKDETGTREVMRETVNRSMTVNEAGIFEFSQSELKKLGLKDAICGMFGESA